MTARKRQLNPWLSIPASDYEGHMGSPSVRQLEFLSAIFGEILAEFRPASVLLLGCATGNGIERIEAGRVRRLIGLDINQDYLGICRERHGGRIPGMELVCADVASFELEPASMDFIYAALFLEYVDPAVVVEKASRWLKPRGIFAVVLQLPGGTPGKVSETGFTSLKALEPVINLVHPEYLGRLVRSGGFSRVRSKRMKLESGKKFFAGVYRLETS